MGAAGQKRNEACACGSGRKFKRCCGQQISRPSATTLRAPNSTNSVGSLLEHGLAAHRLGQLERAANLYEQALALAPDNIDAMHLLGIARREQGRIEDAVALLQRVTTARPRFAEAHCNLGIARHAQGRLDDAVASHRRAIELNDGLAEPWLNLGNALHDLGQHAEALACYERTLALRAIPAAHHNAGNIHLAAGRIDTAIEHYRRALALNPTAADVHASLGIALHRCGQLTEAAASYERALQLNPLHAEAHNNLGNLLRDMERHEEAMLCYRRALALKPGFAEAHNNLGSVLLHFGDLGAAEASVRRALELNPRLTQAHCCLGTVLKAQHRLAEAEQCLRRAIELGPDYAPAYNNLGVTLTDLNRHDEAIESLKRAIALQPEFAEAHNNLGNIYKDQGELPAAVAHFAQAVALKPAYVAAHSNLLFTLNYMEGVAPEFVHARHLEFATHHAEPLRPPFIVHANVPDPMRRLRIGYVSPDLRRHACATFLEPLLVHHDRERFELVAYAEVARPDEVTARLRTLIPNWCSTVGMRDEAVAEKIRRDGIDILVDLAGHSANNRLLVFARKPAPVQITYLGYPATTGLSTMDYRLTDCHTEPVGSTEHNYTETLVRLPHSLWCYRAPAGMPDVAPLPALTEGHLTFGSFNNFAKVGKSVIELWARLLRALPTARLVMLTVPTGSAQQRVRAQFAELGIEEARIELHHKLPPSEYHAVYRRVDIALDPFPCNGGTTTCDALWMGVPVITLIGDTFLSRAGLSLLTVVGLREFAASSKDDYVRIAVRCAQNPDALAHLRSDLRERMRRSPLTDEVQFTRDVEAVYRALWQRWCMRHAPR